MSSESQTFLSGVNAEYIAHLYGQYLKNPDRVDQSWQDFFNDLDNTHTLFQNHKFTDSKSRKFRGLFFIPQF